MKSKKLIPRVLATITTIALMLTSTPLNTLTTFATGGGAGGGFGGGGGSKAVTDNPINDDDIGLRFSLVTKDASGTRVVPTIYSDENGNPKYYIDVWDSYSESWYGAVNSYSRYAPVASDENIKRWNDSSFDANIEKLIADSGKGTVDMNISDHLEIAGASVSTFFTEGEGGLKINGDLFYTWFMEEAGTFEGESHSRYYFFVNALYRDKLNGVDLANTFLVVEPLLHIANPNNNTAYKLLGTEYVASWFGYVEGNISGRKIDVGSASTLRDRFSNIGNHFQIKKTDYLTAEMQTKMTTVLGVGLPGQFTITSEEYAEGTTFYCSSVAYGDGSCGKSSVPAHLRFNYSYRSQGYAMQIFWLKDLDPDTGKPIDTYDIINQTPNIPTPPEEPYDPDSSTDSDSSDTDTANTSGEKTIIKLYADLYKDPNTNYYTYIENIKSGDVNHPYAFVKTDVSNEITITNEEPINGYKVSAWYVSKTAYDSTNKTNNAMLKATNMINVADLSGNKTDGKVSLTNLGGKQLRINNYQAAYKSSGKAGYNSYEGCQKFLASLPDKHGPTGTGTTAISFMNAKNYYTYKRLETKGTSNYGTYNYPVNENDDVVTLGEDDETLVILYTREKTYISTSDLTTDETIEDTPDDREDKSGNLTIVKLYGVINPNNYQITADPSKSSVVTKNTTRNVNIKSESGYNFAEWIYITGGAPTDLTAQRMGTTNLGTVKLDKTLDQAYRLDGFVDGFKNNANLEQYFRFSNGGTLQLPAINIISTDDVSSSITPGRFSYGSRSGIGTGSYNSTLYLGGDKLSDNTPDDTDTNDVLYLLFLKTDQLSYSADDLVIPESYITRYDNLKHHPMTVTGSVSGTTYEEYLQAHKFKYVLPVVTTGTEFKDLNPLFIPHIALTDKTQAGLITNATSVQRLQLNTDLTHEVIKAYTNSAKIGISDYAQLIYLDQGYAITSSASSGKKYVGNMLNVNALNLEYTAYRQGDKVTPAIWKYNKLSTLASSTSPLTATDTKKPLADIAVSNINAAIFPLTNSGAVSSTSSTRKPNDSSQNFKLNFTFSEVGDGIKSVYLQSNRPGGTNSITNLNGVDQPKKITINGTTLNLFKTDSTYSFSAYRYTDNDTRVLGKVECAAIADPQFSDYAIHSLNRLYQIKQSDGTWKYATGVTRYLNTVSDVNITQNVQYNVHYGSQNTNANVYTDKTESGSGTDTTRGQFGYVRSMKASNTITFYPYYVMQYELPESYNAMLNKDGTLKSDLEIKSQSLGNNANQLYIMGEEARSLNVYDYAEVSYYDHAVSSSKGVDVVNNIINSNRKGRIEISSEQWSTHARASSLIGLNNCALPGGATLSITIPAANRQTVTITSYSALLPTESAGYSQVLAYANTNGKTAAFGDMPTSTTDASNRHNMLVESVAAGFEGLNVEQYFSDSDYDFSNTKDGGETYDRQTYENYLKHMYPEIV